MAPSAGDASSAWAVGAIVDGDGVSESTDESRALARLAVFARTEVLDTPAEPRFDAIVAAVKALLDTPIALVSLVERDRQWFKASVGVEMCETSIDTSVCALAIRRQELFVIPDLAADPRTRDFSLVAGEGGLRFYAGFPIVTGDGVAIGSLCAMDIVPRPEGVTPSQAIALEAFARQAAIEIEHRTRGIGGASPEGAVPFSVGSWNWDIPNDRMTADARLARLIGVDPAYAAKGVPMARFLAAVHPADAARVKAAIEATVAGKAPYSCEYRLMTADGTPRWVLAQGRLVRDAAGAPLHFPGATFDIDARRRSEARLAALVALDDRLRQPGEAADLAFAAAEIIGRTLGVGRAGYGIIDHAGETITIERDWNAPGIASIAGTLRFRDFGSYIDDLKAGRTVTVSNADDDPRTRATAAALKRISAHAFINMPLSEGGDVVALLFLNHAAPRPWPDEEVAFVRDVAERTRNAVERRRAEQELARLNRSLEAEVAARTSELLLAEDYLRQSQKMEAVGQLTGGLAHDFNNLLTGISGAVEMMQLRVRQGRTDGLERYADAAHGAVTRAAALTHRLLAFSRRQTLDPKPTDVNRLVLGIEDLVRRTVGPEHAVATDLAEAVWTTLVDPNQLENALLNLCLNARDAMPDGGSITIGTGNVTLDEAKAREHDVPAGDYVTLCVADTGSGMSTDVKARAFDPFYTTKPMGEGTGLGLSMIYGFARQSGGQVAIDTVLGEGTVMCLYLPRSVAVAEVPPEGAASTRSRTGGGAARSTVLVVDDEATVRMLVVEAVTDLGHDVLEAADGAAALRILQARGASIDLLVTDVGLPGGMNGRQVADAALVAYPKLPVLFITGYAETAVIGGDQLDPNMMLMTKPFTMDALAERVGALLERRG